MNKKITIVKLKEAEKPYHPNNIEEGYRRTGNMSKEPIVGEAFYLTGIHFSDCWRTSPVVEIINKDTFRTYNSIYHIIREDTRVVLIEKVKF